MAIANNQAVFAATVADLERAGRLTLNLQDHTIVLFSFDGKVYAVNNRCPHMGFPLDRGSVQDGILTCHWHHARFDLCSGGTFDQSAELRLWDRRTGALKREMRGHTGFV